MSNGAGLEFEVKDQVAWLTMNRPELRNAVDHPLRDAIIAAVEEVRDDPDIRAAVAEIIDDFTLKPAAPDADLEIAFRPAGQAHAIEVANQLAARLQPRLRRLRLRVAD